MAHQANWLHGTGGKVLSSRASRMSGWKTSMIRSLWSYIYDGNRNR